MTENSIPQPGLAGTLPVLMARTQVLKTKPRAEPHPHDPRFKNLTGQVFGRLTVLYYTGKAKRKAQWQCTCDCGTEVTVSLCHLTSGHTRSCGCLNQETRTTHGLAYSEEYKIWHGMVSRCQAKTGYTAGRYAGRGITVAVEWKKSFATFYKDMGPRPTPKHTIERVDNTKGYCKENCQWDTRMRQALNREPQSNNISGVSGVTWDAARHFWMAGITRMGKQVVLGRYPTIEEATKARNLATAKAETLTYEQIITMTTKEFRRFIRSAL
jgi:hypothetical protein